MRTHLISDLFLLIFTVECAVKKHTAKSMEQFTVGSGRGEAQRLSLRPIQAKKAAVVSHRVDVVLMWLDGADEVRSGFRVGVFVACPGLS